MKKTLFLLAAVLALGASSFAAPLCVSGAVALNTIGTCDIGDKEFSNFTFSSSEYTSSQALIRISQLTPTTYKVELLAPPSANTFFSQVFDLNFTISVLANTGVNVPPSDFKLTAVKDQTNYNIGGGNGQVTDTKSNGLILVMNPGTDTTGIQGVIPAQTTLTSSVHYAGSSVAGGINSVEFQFAQSDTSVPEPLTMSLMGAGLLAVGLLRRRIAR